MNYIDVIKALWKWYQSSILEPNDYCLMMRLIAISNDDMGWEDCFLRNNYELIGSTKLSFKQLTNSRNKLQQIGLISFVQKNGLPNCKYEIHYEALLDLGKKGKAEGKVRQRFGKGDGIDKLNQTKQNHLLSGGKPPAKKKAVAETTLHWKALVDAWFVFYKKEKGDDPTFDGQHKAHFKKIIEKLKARADKKNVEWTESAATERLRLFLENAVKDRWIRENLLLSNLEKMFDKIIATLNGNNSTPATGSGTNKKSGGSIEAIQALKRGTANETFYDTYPAGDADFSGGEEWSQAEVVK